MDLRNERYSENQITRRRRRIKKIEEIRRRMRITRRKEMEGRNWKTKFEDERRERI